jgi:hypothetical protein
VITGVVVASPKFNHPSFTVLVPPTELAPPIGVASTTELGEIIGVGIAGLFAVARLEGTDTIASQIMC